jgi:hypothetical protein
MGAWDDFLHDMSRMNDAIGHSNDLRRLQERLRTEDAEHEKTIMSLVRTYALREAAFAQLECIDPTNPLVVDKNLQASIGAAAQNAFSNHPGPDGVRTYERAREVGRSFKIPGRPGRRL